MNASDNENSIEKIKQEHRINASPRPATGFDNKVTDVQLSFHNQWAKTAFSQSKYKFSYASLKRPNLSDASSLINDLTPISDSQRKDELDINRIKQIYNMKKEKEITYSPLSSAISYDLTFSQKIPRDLLEPDYGWLSFSLGKCTLPNDYESQEITGFIQLYDGKNESPVSEPVRFYITKGEAFFSQTIASSVNFPLSTKNPYILCVLNYLHKIIKCPIPFALDIIPLFSEKGQFLHQKTFTSQWASYSNNFEQFIQKKISKDDSYEKVDIEFNFNCTFSEKLEREFSYSWSLTPNTNYYVSPFPNFSYQSTPTILLFNFNLTMKYPTNAKYVFLKLFVTDGIESISSPKKLPLFCGIEQGKFSEVYITTANKVNSKEVEFIDQASIYVDRVFTQTSCIAIHIYCFDKMKSDALLLGYSAIPLFQDGSPLPYGGYKLKIFDPKKLPKEMKKLISKKSSKKKEFLTCKIRLPPPYFPPLTVKNVIDAVMPEQALPPNYKEISLDVYQRQVLPMTGKLLKIIAPNTALHLIRFLDIFEDEKSNIVSTLRSWIFNVMNPDLFGSNFINNLCKAFKSVINDELLNSNRSVNDPSLTLRETKNLLLKQLGFALPLILDIIIVSVSNPDVSYDIDIILDFLSLIPGIIYGLFKLNHNKTSNNNSNNVSHVKNENFSSRASHNHHIGHSQRKSPLASGEDGQLSSENNNNKEELNKESSSSNAASTSTSTSRAPSMSSQSNSGGLSQSIENNEDSSIMAPIRLPPQAMSPIIPDMQTSHHLRPVSSNASLLAKRSSQFILNRNESDSQMTTKNISDEIDLNDHYANLISVLLPIVGFEKVSPIVFQYIRFLNTKKSNHSNSSAFLSFLQFSFLMPFSFSEQFIVELALHSKISNSQSSGVSAYIPILSQVYLVLHKSLGGQENNNSKKDEKSEIDAIDVACKFFSNICLSAENLTSELKNKVAFILFPLINIISSNYEGAFVKQNSQVLKDLIPTILFVLNASNTNLIQNYFSELGTSFQIHFMNFLEFIVRLSIEKLNSIRPVSIKVKRSGDKNKNQSESNLQFFSILTQQILNFLLRTIDIIGSCIDLVVKLLSSLFNSYQPISNIKQFFIVCSNLIQKYPINRSLIAWLLSLLSFEQPDTKCFACALLVLVFEADYENSESVIISSIDMMDSLTAVLLAVPVKYIPTYKALLNRIISLTKDYPKKEFEKMVDERMNASLIILNVVQEQKNSTSPPEIKCQRLMRIADQYKAFPTMRLKWLQEIVKVNSQQKIFSAAFTAQLHVCCLVETVVYQLQNSNISMSLQSYNSISLLSSSSTSLIPPPPQQQSSSQQGQNSMSSFDFFLKTTQPMRNASFDSFKIDPKEDFSFMPGVLCETELDIDSLANDSQTLLSDFTIELLLDSLEKAIQLGKPAGLDYSLRPLYSLKLRIHEFKRNEPEKISEVLTQLGESIANLQTKTSSFYDPNLSFFLVEYRKSSSQKKLQVFCVENSMVDQFNEFISEKGRFEEGTSISFCNNHSDENCSSEKGVCVIRLQPVFQSDKNESDHCFKKFITVQNFLNDDSEKVDVIQYFTKDFLPHYRVAADVVDEKRQKVDRLSHITSIVENQTDLLNRVAEEFEVWYPLKPLSGSQKVVSSLSKTDEKFVIDDIKRISAVLRFVLKGNESVATVLSNVFQKVKGKNDSEKVEIVKSLAASIQKAVARILAVYRRAVREFNTKQPNMSLLSLCEMMAEEFEQAFDLEKIEASEYVAEYDPMNDGIEYND